ncbi:MAG: Ni/Fe hydrogenase subunit alpha [Deltaproteobacteria bacterium]|nr:Ni/Fe hydrogenase subunit alpha [Deltaproteobacteria bacterium]
MGNTFDIHVHHLTRVEGHGNIVVNMREGALEKCHLQVVEAPRYFEAMIRGRSFHEAAVLTSRICGICSLGHQLTSLKATEAALGLEVSEQTVQLRKLLVDGATFQSNVLHALFLAAPDFLGVGSVFPLVQTHPEVVLAALRMKRLANDIGEVVSGRAVHPITCVPGGFTQLPSAPQLRQLLLRLQTEARADLELAVQAVLSVAGNIPAFARETEYISLKSDREYALYDGVIHSSDAGATPVNDYLGVTNEQIKPHSTAKHTHYKRTSYMVGALSRWNNNHQQMNEAGRAVGKALGLSGPSHNPYHITVAQLAETAHCVRSCIERIDALLTRGLKEEKPDQEPTRYGRGVGSTEVPRGILFHDYTYDRKGTVVAANCIIPTNQNFANIDDDMVKLVPEIVHLDRAEITRRLEMLVRAYDPCISCSVHMVDVTFVE